jgi:hypothetical protein
MNACAKAKFDLAIAEACLAARLAINKKWYKGEMDASHEKHIEQVKNRIVNSANAVTEHCGKK